MVNRGRSGGCATCKQRRVKCDEAKPECLLCRRLGIRCEGYQTNSTRRKLKFKDENHKFRIKAAQIQDRAAVPRPLAEPDTAVPFYLWHYANMGRDFGSARGFFEILIPVYCSQKQDSVLSLAVSAMASRILALWRHDTRNFLWPEKAYAQAVACLRRAVQDQSERSKPATILAVLMLQLYDDIAAVYGVHSATRVHHNGAVSLLPFANSNDINGMIGAYIRRFMIHTEISSAMRQKRPLQSIEYSWIGSKHLMAAPDNPSSALDAIGASVAELQASYMRLEIQKRSMPLSQLARREWRAEAKRIDEQLLAWAQSVPDHWRPLKLISGRDIDPSIPTYRSVCEVYPSCTIANIWNLWRFQRLLLAKITFGLFNKTLSLSPDELARDQYSGEIEGILECKQIFQELVDSVCYSMPFYLGNRTRLCSIADFDDPTILLPSCDSLLPGDEGPVNKQTHDPRMSKDEHRRHIIAQGPWHAMSPLSRLLTLSSEDQGQLITSLLRPGQYEWIREQFLRVTILLHIPLTEASGRNEGCRVLDSVTQGSNMYTKAEFLAREVRKGAIFMSGP
ncbi:transcriptional regulator family: Fungal Specific TF [Paecilomyces variotii]|nr:transcriptional regulator family: Fungal Specific TF [Paecilomyces variotii]KAJ9364028.1 transcriptional regulator family: Fungal Specific TF [Paecilomyces variotii]